MEIFKLKISSKIDPEVYRVIDISSASNFETLHKFILKSFNYSEGELASFYLNYEDSESRMEICLSEMQMDDGAMLMQEMRLKDIISDDNNELIYIYDFINFITFQLDFLSCYTEKSGEQFPSVSEMAGDMPLQEDLFGLADPEESEDDALVREMLNKNSDLFDEEEDGEDSYREDYYDNLDDLEDREF